MVFAVRDQTLIIFKPGEHTFDFVTTPVPQHLAAVGRETLFPFMTSGRIRSMARAAKRLQCGSMSASLS